MCAHIYNIGVPQNAAIAWSDRGEARLHVACWKLALKSARARSKKSSSMSVAERALVKEAAATVEFHDSAADVCSAAARIASMLQHARHCVAFTGAGISTSAGIGDYRGKSGKWTELDRGAASDDDGVPYEQLRPTYTHEALVKLVEMGLIKHIISQNGDGLHTLSGVQPENLSELHGNVFIEVCTKCGHQFDRLFYVMDDAASQHYEELEDNGRTEIPKPLHAAQCKMCGLNHHTQRQCSDCKGQLKDTIINFGDDLDAATLETAEQHATRSDLCLSLGSTMLVTPACSLIEMGCKPLRLVVVNRQKTGFDEVCLQQCERGEPLGVRVFGDCDDVMHEVLCQLMGVEQARSWESKRNQRMKQYNTLRSCK